MKIAIGLILKYSFEVHELSRIVLDMYKFYHHAFCQQADKLWIISDIGQDEDHQRLLTAFRARVVSGDVMDLISTIRNKNQYIDYQYEPSWLYYKLDELIRPETTQLLFYFTGHGNPTHIVLPNHDKLMHQSFFDLCLSKINRPDQSMVMIFDCCHGIDTNLPYYLDIEKEQWIKRSDIFRSSSRANILLLCSCVNDELASIEPTGSIFTRSLIDSINRNNLKDLKLSIVTLIKFLRSITHKNCQIYSNNQLNFKLPNWLYLNKYRITKDPFYQLILIEYEHQ